MNNESGQRQGMVLAGERTTYDQIAQPIPIGGESPSADHRVRTIMNGDVVVAIEVTCDCGKKTRVNLGYE